MPGLQPSLYSIGLALCVFCTGLLTPRRTRTGRPLRLFSAYLGLETLGFTLELLIAHPDSPFKALWLALRLATSLWIAPLLWLALTEVVTGRSPRLRDLSWPHYAVILVAAVCTLPLMTTAHAGSTWANPAPTQLLQGWAYRSVHAAMLVCIGLFAIQAPFYLHRTLRLLRQHAPDAGRAWLHLPVLMVGTTWILGLLRTAQCITHAPAEWVAFFAFIDVSVTIGALYLIVRREFQPSTEPAALPSSGTKYAKSQLEDLHVQRIRRKLDEAFATRQLHHDSLLNLRGLSQSLGEKPHYVSQVINQDLGTTFYDLVNRARISEARHLLRTELDRTVLDIALAVGFNAKSTFNTAFKRHTGQTPSTFRRGPDGGNATQ